MPVQADEDQMTRGRTGGLLEKRQGRFVYVLGVREVDGNV